MTLDLDQSLIKGYHKNPRQITSRQFNDLVSSMEDLGDISGIIINKPTMEFVGGNMRTRAIDLNESKIEWTHTYETPTDVGTLALGYVSYMGEYFSVRLVDWSERQCELANVRANKMGGTFDFDILANEFDIDTLLDSGFSSMELEGIDIEDDYVDEEIGDDEIPEDSQEKFGMPTIAIIFNSTEEAESAQDIIREFISSEFPDARVAFSSN